jgi:CO/xanthine dehydrogenase FAD-binding subunit
LEDLTGSAEYRANLVVVMARRALQYLGSAHAYK